LGEGIYPTPVLGVVGILEDVHKTARMHFSAPGRAVMLLHVGIGGDITDAKTEFGSSDYAKEVLGFTWGYPPELDIEKEAMLQKAIIDCVRQELLSSAHDCTEGGIAVALAEMTFAKQVGVRVDLASNGLFAEYNLFGEDASRVIVSCDPDKVERIKQIAAGFGVTADILGETIPEKLEILLDSKAVISGKVSDFEVHYENALENTLKTDPELVAAD
jgi:phosphoribosylformylglycinamidine synthase